MKIKKTFQGVIPENKILNAESTSQTDTYSCDYINNTSIVVSPTEPTGKNRKKVWMQNTDTDKKIYIKNSNDVYEEFMKKDEETYLITNEAEHDGTNSYSLKRKENLVIFSFNSIRIKNITQNTWLKICEIPNSIKPNVNFVPVILSGVINMGTGNIVGLAKLELRQDGGVYIKPNITYSDVGILGTLSWFL